MRALLVAGWFLTVSGVPGTLAGQVTTEVTGTVRSDEGTPVPYAHVRVDGEASAVGDAGGAFRLTDVPRGSRRIEVRATGYSPAIHEVEVGDEPVRLPVFLRASPLSIPGVQVTATPGGGEVRSATQATTQLRGRALERSLGGTLGQTLAEQPGIAVRYNGPGAAAPVVRGLGGDRILLLQDGQRAGDLSGSADDHGVTIDPLTAQRIEVVRGPAALMYGNNALGGVVNVITGEPAAAVPEHSEWIMAAQAETAYPGGGLMLRGTVPVGSKVALTIRTGFRGSGDVRIGDDPVLGGRLDNTGKRNAELAAGGSYIGDGVSAGVTVRGYDFEYGMPLPPSEPGEIELMGRIASANGRAEFDLDWTRFPSLRITASAQDYLHEEFDSGELQMAFALRTQTFDLLLRQERVGRFAEGAWGLTGLFRQYASTGVDQLTPPADSRGVGFYGFQQIALGRDVALQFGGRLDHYAIGSRDDAAFGAGTNRRFTATSGSVGLSVPLPGGVSLAGSLASSFRAPTVEELYSDALHVGAGAYEIGDPSLRPERAVGVDAIVRVQNERLNSELAVYRNRVSDFVRFTEGGSVEIGESEWPVLRYTQGDAILTGVEGFAEWLVTRRIVASIRGDRVLGERTDGAPLPFIPASRIGGSLRWEGEIFSLGGSGSHSFAQDRVGLEGELATDAYTLFGIDAGVRFRTSGTVHSITVKAENVTDRLYRDASSRIKDFAPNPGRNLSLFYRVFF